MHTPYDPFVRGPFPVGVQTVRLVDATRDARALPVEIWYPATAHYAGQDLAVSARDTFAVAPGFPSVWQAAVREAVPRPGPYPLVLFSHGSFGHRRQSTFLCTHLASHGYVVGAVDHTGNTVREVAEAAWVAQCSEDAPERLARIQAMIAARIPDIRCLLDQLLGGAARAVASLIDPQQVGMAGYSFGGWTALAATAVDRRIRAVLVLAPAGSARPRPGIIPVSLTFDWGREVPTFFLVAERDTLLPLAGMYELWAQIRARKHMVILHNADHFHFCDYVEHVHEWFRTRPSPGASAWTATALPPVSALCPGAHAHLCIRGLGLAHMDAVLKGHKSAQRLLASDLAAVLAGHGVTIAAHTS